MKNILGDFGGAYGTSKFVWEGLITPLSPPWTSLIQLLYRFSSIEMGNCLKLNYDKFLSIDNFFCNAFNVVNTK